MQVSESAKASVVSNIAALVALGLMWADLLVAAPLDYSVHKTLHILGIMLFIGNLIVGPVWVLAA
ncbi:MAG: hypothetical protein EXR77_13825 [Myxococcales bacterium]|nr:hypothetical protein [Myxococcales bacterium]